MASLWVMPVAIFAFVVGAASAGTHADMRERDDVQGKGQLSVTALGQALARPVRR